MANGIIKTPNRVLLVDTKETISYQLSGRTFVDIKEMATKPPARAGYILRLLTVRIGSSSPIVTGIGNDSWTAYSIEDGSGTRDVPTYFTWGYFPNF